MSREKKLTDQPKSLITGGETRYIFKHQVLNRYLVRYFRCLQTGFIQTEEPFWLDEAYSSPIANIDLGYVNRNIESSRLVTDLIDRCLPNFSSGLDYGGGYGIFVRRMRDLGFQFFHQDPHCPNLFAMHFDRVDSPKQRFDVATAFEVFEHVPNPREVVQELLELAPTIVFSTELQPNTTIRSVNDWWYFIPETGQHISFYTRESLEFLAKQFGAKYYTDGVSLHVISREILADEPFPPQRRATLFQRGLRKLHRIVKRVVDSPMPAQRASLLKDDFERVRRLLNKPNQADHE
jgi:hypothetical protein